MSQQDLINWRPMTTTREMSSAKRATAEAKALRASLTTRAEKSPAGPAAEAGLLKTRCIENSQGRRLSQSDETEFNLPDEDRVLTTLSHLPRCECCGTRAELERKGGLFQVHCWHRAESILRFSDRSRRCQQPTPWFSSSTQAINHWKLVSKLQS